MIIPPDFRSRLLPITLGQVIGMSCGVVGVRLMSHLVTPSDYGVYGLFLTATPLGMWVVHAGLIKFVNRHWGASRSRPSLLREISASFLRKLPWLVIAAAAVAYGVNRAAWPSTFALLAISASFVAITALVQASLQSAQDNWRDLALTSTGSLTRTFLPPLFYIATGGTAITLCTAFGVHALVTAAVSAWFLRRYWPGPKSTPTTLATVYDGPLFVILAICGWIMAGLNRWIAAGFFGAAVAGYFTLAANIALTVASLLGTIFTQYFQPGFFLAPQETPTERKTLAKHVDRVALAYCVMSVLGVSLLQWCAPWLVGSLISEKYRPAISFIIPAGFSLTAMITGAFYHSLLLAGKREIACAPADLSLAFVVAGGAIAAAAWGGTVWFSRWLCVVPIAPWLLSRPIARYYFFRPASGHEPAMTP